VVLGEVAQQRIFADADDSGDLLMGQIFTFEQEGFHLTLDVGMRMMETLKA
jgi:hypothetical protein